MSFVKAYMKEVIPVILLVLLVAIATAKINFHNGRVDMCKELGGEIIRDNFDNVVCMNTESVDLLTNPEVTMITNPDYIKNILR